MEAYFILSDTLRNFLVIFIFDHMKNKFVHICVLLLGQLATLSIQIFILRVMGVGVELSRVLIYIAPAQFAYSVLSTHFQYAIFSRVNVISGIEEKFNFYEKYAKKQYLSLVFEFIIVLLISSIYIKFINGIIDFSLLIKVQIMSFSIYIVNILSFVYRYKRKGIYYDLTLAIWSGLILLAFYIEQPKISHDLVNLQLSRYVILLFLLIFIIYTISKTIQNFKQTKIESLVKRYNLRILPLITITKSAVILESTLIIWSTPEYISIYNLLIICFTVVSSIIDKVFLVPSYVAQKALYLRSRFVMKQTIKIFIYLTLFALGFCAILIFAKMFWVKIIGIILGMTNDHSQLVFECGVILLFVIVLSGTGGPLSQGFYAKGKGEVMQFIGIGVILGMLPIYFYLYTLCGFIGIFYAMAIRYLFANLIAGWHLLKMEKTDEI